MKLTTITFKYVEWNEVCVHSLLVVRWVSKWHETRSRCTHLCTHIRLMYLRTALQKAQFSAISSC